jgi:hypothetical protein
VRDAAQGYVGRIFRAEYIFGARRDAKLPEGSSTDLTRAIRVTLAEPKNRLSHLPGWRTATDELLTAHANFFLARGLKKGAYACKSETLSLSAPPRTLFTVQQFSERHPAFR